MANLIIPDGGNIGSSSDTDAIAISSGGNVTLSQTLDGGAIGSAVTMSANQACVKTALNASGSAPIYACRAWVNFPGNTSSPTANADGNVDSITYNGTGKYTINIDVDLDDGDYAVMGSCTNNGTGGKHLEFTSLAGGSVEVRITRSNGSSAKTLESANGVFVAIFR